MAGICDFGRIFLRHNQMETVHFEEEGRRLDSSALACSNQVSHPNHVSHCFNTHNTEDQSEESLDARNEEMTVLSFVILHQLLRRGFPPPPSFHQTATYVVGCAEPTRSVFARSLSVACACKGRLPPLPPPPNSKYPRFRAARLGEPYNRRNTIFSYLSTLFPFETRFLSCFYFVSVRNTICILFFVFLRCFRLKHHYLFFVVFVF